MHGSCLIEGASDIEFNVVAELRSLLAQCIRAGQRQGTQQS
ncbi:hypothetical protein [Chondromyces crocatus]|uniref:Uncharacterized protein n=1 Tax=Chondromyces crocatus TaxID=52 RepID=A0A0K1ESU7_CHOCO|nr:hypothetical protein [Chondromyces crocatus]AKT44010.1 uncharacterized protein CMC5_082480 [Chondromyces crocatus]